MNVLSMNDAQLAAKKEAKRLYDRERLKRPEVAARNRARARAYNRSEKGKAALRVRTARQRDSADPRYLQKRLEDAVRTRTPEGQRKRADKHLKRKFAMSITDYDSMLLAQEGLCKICLEPPHRKRKAHVDHDHVTGKVRGILCHDCNRLLGAARDRVDILRAAVIYLETDHEISFRVRTVWKPANDTRRGRRLPSVFADAKIDVDAIIARVIAKKTG